MSKVCIIPQIPVFAAAAPETGIPASFFRHSASNFLQNPVKLSPLFQQFKLILVKSKDPFIPQAAEFGGHGAAVHREIVRELLTVERNREFRGLAPLGLPGQIGQKLVPRSALCHALQLPGQLKIAACHNSKQIRDHPVVERTCVGTGCQKRLHPKKDNFRWFDSNSSHLNGNPRCGRIGLTEHFAGPDFGQDTAVAPEILLDHVNLAGTHQPDIRIHLPVVINPLALRKVPPLRVQTMYHRIEFVGRDPVEERRLQVPNFKIFHGNAPFV